MFIAEDSRMPRLRRILLQVFSQRSKLKILYYFIEHATGTQNLPCPTKNLVSDILQTLELLSVPHYFRMLFTQNMKNPFRSYFFKN